MATSTHATAACVTAAAVVALLFLASRRKRNIIQNSPPSPQVTFVRAKGGLCNKLRVVLSYREAAVVDGGHQLVVVWVVNDECPARYCDLFEPLDGVLFLDSDDPQLEEKLIALGSPHGSTMKRDMRTHPAIAALENENEKWLSDREAAMFLSLVPIASIQAEIAAMVRQCGDGFAAVHVRRTDHVALWGISTPDDEFYTFVDKALQYKSKGSHGGACVFVATDNAETQSLYAQRYGTSRVHALHPIEMSPTALRHTSVRDAVIDLYVCASSRVFKGTRGSSFSDAIWLIRKARGVAHQNDELHTNRQLRRRRWRQQKAAKLGEARAVAGEAERRRVRSTRQAEEEEEVENDDRSTNLQTAAADNATRGGTKRQTTTATPRLQMVVAHYSSTCFESLVEAVDDAIGCETCHVYDKSEDGSWTPSEPSPSAFSRYVTHRVPNVGRESETYLRYLIDHYESLPEYMLLVQDDTQVHVPRQHVDHFCEQISKEMQGNTYGRVLQVVHRGRRLYPPRKIDAHDKMHGRLQAACERFGLSMPQSYLTHVCAFLLVSRECVHSRPKAFYEELHKWHSEERSVKNRRGATEEQLAPWLLEHLWQLVFGFSEVRVS